MITLYYQYAIDQQRKNGSTWWNKNFKTFEEAYLFFRILKPFIRKYTWVSGIKEVDQINFPPPFFAEIITIKPKQI